MNKNWKKRLSVFLRDSDTYTVLPIGIAFIGLISSFVTNLIFAGFLNFSILSTTLWTFAASAFACVAICLVEVLFLKESGYDKMVEKEEEEKKKNEQAKKREEEKQKAKEEEEKRQKRFEAIRTLSQAIQGLTFQDDERDLVLAIKQMIHTIEHIMDTYDLTIEEEHYLFKKLPSYLKEIVLSYEKLLDKNKKKQKEVFLKLLQEKQQELETIFINRHQENIMMEMDKNMRMLDQNIYQKVYETE